jgi:hypothetical protein
MHNRRRKRTVISKRNMRAPQGQGIDDDANEEKIMKHKVHVSWQCRGRPATYRQQASMYSEACWQRKRKAYDIHQWSWNRRK